MAKVLAWFKANWKTSLAGVFALALTACSAFPQLAAYLPIIQKVQAALVGFGLLAAADSKQ